jgi:hypothetical protein
VFGVDDLNAYYRSFCQREPIGGMFLESVIIESCWMGLRMENLPKALGFPL